jgi:hypothetical protein
VLIAVTGANGNRQPPALKPGLVAVKDVGVAMSRLLAGDVLQFEQILAFDFIRKFA